MNKFNSEITTKFSKQLQINLDLNLNFLSRKKKLNSIFFVKFSS